MSEALANPVIAKINIVPKFCKEDGKPPPSTLENLRNLEIFKQYGTLNAA